MSYIHFYIDYNIYTNVLEGDTCEGKDVPVGIKECPNVRNAIQLWGQGTCGTQGSS